MKKISYGLMAFCFCFLTSSLFAQITVVRVEGNKVFMDTSSVKEPIKEGDSFKVILSSEKLTNPKTGKELGIVHNYSTDGKITEVQPLYAVGTLPKNAQISIGQEVVFEKNSQPAQPSSTQPAAALSDNHSLTRYNPVEQIIISLTEVNFAGQKHLVTLSEDNQVTVWQRGEDKNLKTLFTYTLPKIKKGISLSAKDIKGSGNDQLFVVAYDQHRQTIGTIVLEVQGNTLAQISSLPYFVKELGCGNSKTLWAQRPFVTSDRPGNAKNVIYKKDTFTTGQESFSTQHNWLVGMNRYPIQNENYQNLIYTSSNGKLIMTLENGKRAQSSNEFASTPNRISYKQEIVRFYPSLQVFSANGNAQIVAVENLSKMGILSDTFGQYQNGKIHWLAYEQGHLKIIETTPLDGILYDTACTDSSILTAEVLNDGTSTVVELSK